jgi:hypothetical protein
MELKTWFKPFFGVSLSLANLVMLEDVVIYQNINLLIYIRRNPYKSVSRSGGSN